MILTCTSCSTRYYADDAAIGPTGRTVRCAACGTSWFAEPAGGAAETGEVRAKQEPLTRERVERLRRAASQAGPAPSAAAKFRAQQAERMRRDRARAAVAAWGATGAAVAASVAGMVTFREEVAQVWPSSATAYAAVGMPVNVYGFEFFDLTVERAFDGPTPLLLVSGEVRNITRKVQDAPPVRVTLRDAQANEIYQVVYNLDAGAMDGGESAPFQFRVENPPVEAVDLETSFADIDQADAYEATPRMSPPAPVGEEPLELDVPLDAHSELEFDDGLNSRFSEPDMWTSGQRG